MPTAGVLAAAAVAAILIVGAAKTAHGVKRVGHQVGCLARRGNLVGVPVGQAHHRIDFGDRPERQALVPKIAHRVHEDAPLLFPAQRLIEAIRDEPHFAGPV